MRIFGREPVVILALVSILLKLGAAYGLDVSADQQGSIMAVLSCLVAAATAVVLKTGAVYAALVNVGQAVLWLVMAFGMRMPAETQALWMLAIEGALALLVRRDVEAPVPLTRIEMKSPVAPQRPHGI
ncbi:hypothetical protein [Streptomyces sp. DH12]|uniref:hypothetical protein n=1 Tax=Streptomyces sp. DH12 TaxID=2857010 RepID=UPI001E64BCDF|nr:hypothetical protein [Streptomyces sp. DH12]